MNLKDIAKNPVSWLVGVIASIAAVDPSIIMGLAEATVMNLGSLFSLTTISALTLPEFYPPNNPLDFLIFGIGIAYAAKIAHGIWTNYDRELDES